MSVCLLAPTNHQHDAAGIILYLNSVNDEVLTLCVHNTDTRFVTFWFSKGFCVLECEG